MEISTAGRKAICLPIISEVEYRKLMETRSTLRTYLDEHVHKHPELFPTEITNGYWLHDKVRTKLVLADFVESSKALRNRALKDLGSVSET